ncbi:MAG: family 20 glycosylhydrolase [Pseudomonadales bacterium]|nr:family 20 glycosylhydrolase [Pseudomonadales bacterium]
MKAKLYPAPRSIRYQRGIFDGTRRDIVKLDAAITGEVLDAVRRAIGEWHPGLALTHGKAEPASTLLTISYSRGGHPESYRLTCSSDGINLTAGTPQGFWYGIMTLRQLSDQCGRRIPHVDIRDEPDFANRGVMLDISRCKVPSQETLMQMIDGFARLKFNQLQLYTEHTFAFTGHSLVWADSSPLTGADILALQAYCRDRFIELVPNLNSFGHFERWLRYPEYHAFAECPDGFTHPFSGQPIEFGSTLKPDKKSLSLLRDLYDEYLPLFTSSEFNIGGDEPWELGKGASRARCEKEGTTNVYIDFLSQIQQEVEKRGRHMMFWSDIVLREPASLSRLSRNLTALNWGYEGNHPFNKECTQVAGAGLPFYVCPGTSSWNSLVGRTSNMERNLANASKAGLANGAIGYLVTDWGDHGHHQYLPVSYPGFVMAGCHAWNAKGARAADAADGVDRIFAQDEKIGTLITDMGRVLELAPSKIRNETIFNRLLFWQMEHEPSAVAGIDDGQLADCDEAFIELDGRLATLPSGSLVADELANAIRLARHGIHRLQYFRGTRKDRRHLREELSVAIGEHERLWLARNRSGGLSESAGHLRQSLTAL